MVNVVIGKNVGSVYYVVNGYIQYASSMPEREPVESTRPYHHGNLRATLLDAAERTLRDQGIEHVSIRDLARQVGVSHAAPSRHFRDRQALLDGLAAAGYLRLGDEIAAAVADADKSFGSRLRAVAMTYVRFALENAALLDLMFATGKAGRNYAAAEAFGRPYAILSELVEHGRETGELRAGDPQRLCVIIVATFRGIATLVGSGGVPVEQTNDLVAEAAALFTA